MMKDKFLKILLVILLILPMWMTLVAFSEEKPATTNNSWKDFANAELLKKDSTKVQIIKVLEESEAFDPAVTALKFSLDTEAFNANGASTLSLRFTDAEGRLAKLIRIKAELSILKHVAVATRSIRGGETLQSGDFVWEWREAKALSPTAVMGQAPIGSALKSAVRSGEVLDQNRFNAASMVRKGEMVSINVAGHGISISGKGVAQEAGKLGQTIRVLNIDSKKEIFGVVTGQERVEVRI